MENPTLLKDLIARDLSFGPMNKMVFTFHEIPMGNQKPADGCLREIPNKGTSWFSVSEEGCILAWLLTKEDFFTHLLPEITFAWNPLEIAIGNQKLLVIEGLFDYKD